jgi:CBS domain-containing protein
MKSTVKDVMTTRVVWVKKSASFREMARALRENRISAFPVLDDEGKVIGVVSEADMLTKEALGGEHDGLPGMVTDLLHHKDRVKARGITAGDLMTAPPVTVGPEDTVKHAARLMYTRKVKRVPVVDADGHLAGILSRADVLAVFDRPDEDIRREVNAEVFFDQVLGDPDRLSVAVKDGVVTLAGTPETEAIGREIVDQTRHIQGVVAVRDRLSYPPPKDSGYDSAIMFSTD